MKSLTILLVLLGVASCLDLKSLIHKKIFQLASKKSNVARFGICDFEEVTASTSLTGNKVVPAGGCALFRLPTSASPWRRVTVRTANNNDLAYVEIRQGDNLDGTADFEAQQSNGVWIVDFTDCSNDDGTFYLSIEGTAEKSYNISLSDSLYRTPISTAKETDPILLNFTTPSGSYSYSTLDYTSAKAKIIYVNSFTKIRERFCISDTTGETTAKTSKKSTQLHFLTFGQPSGPVTANATDFFCQTPIFPDDAVCRPSYASSPVRQWTANEIAEIQAAYSFLGFLGLSLGCLNTLGGLFCETAYEPCDADNFPRPPCATSICKVFDWLKANCGSAFNFNEATELEIDVQCKKAVDEPGCYRPPVAGVSSLAGSLILLLIGLFFTLF